ncbi:Alpha-xylosidase [Labeo rohita]|uniref:Alpha-xylosidase n=1 Tax=Labeo rohita TaxID=84645 RepID=A0ABQ8L5N8_LABRO|nr:Alpha-xylosidase [Labeo rohita]
MSQLTEREQRENTDEGESLSGKDRSVDQAMEAQSYAHSSSCADLTVPCSGVLSEDMQDVKKDIVNKKISIEQQSISELEKKKREGKIRPVVLSFTDRSTKDLLLEASKTEYHRYSNFKFEKELTAKDKAKRQRLWPKIEAARKEGKKAFFVGAKVIIDGKEITE